MREEVLSFLSFYLITESVNASEEHTHGGNSSWNAGCAAWVLLWNSVGAEEDIYPERKPEETRVVTRSRISCVLRGPTARSRTGAPLA